MAQKLTVKEELTMLRSAVIGLVGRDREGSYRPEFVREMFSDLRRRPTKTFTNKETFLVDVDNA